MKKVVIVGAGPAGLFAAYELAGKADVTILDKGKSIEKRICPTPGNCNKKCKGLCAVLYGEGGAGLMSDGKIIFHTEVGSNLNSIEDIGYKKNQELVDRVEEIFKLYGVEKEKETKLKLKQIKNLEAKATKAGIRTISTKLAHVGTDKLAELMTEFRNDLIDKGVKFITNTDVTNISNNENNLIIHTKKEDYNCDKVILAPGRVGAKWLKEIVDDLGIKYGYNPMDLGVRVEVKREVTDHITELVRDMKFYIETPTYNDIVRTFCTCPGGKVARETHDLGFNLVNGQSEKNDPYENTNFAFLVTIPFTEPMANGNEYSRLEAEKIKELGGDKPILQRLGDLKSGRRSKRKDLEKYLVKPSLENVTFGDIGLALSYRIILDLMEGFDILNRIMPGIANDNTLLYAPETKFHSIKVKNSDPYLQTNIPGIYVAGDGAGLSRGIVGAAACGVLAAEGILKDIKG
ncbi:MAG: FAD-dependent oxidoreductase [Nanoarchaeota archaeon]|nr:FAD-dependent oxidoreductase [Nanoarchaeota archaeon]MBU4352371.1 FAD-dependent oxidoreductase [Nanoarchaeota archaeon]MBU4456752.1 FAD-dependent oxidoreductase [Nanoarchaeota archaeon]MCG2719338.1 FAD-dependent oxidoreductase [Nanoarchaeota archaeon]